MLKTILATIITFILLSPNAYGAVETNADFKVRLKTIWKENNNPYTKEIYAKVQRRDVWTESNGHIYDHWEVNIGNTTPRKLFEYGAGFRYIETNGKTEWRPHVFLTPQFKAFNNEVKFSLRNKMEYRIFDESGVKDGFRYKIKPKVAWTIKANDWFKFTPFIADEVAYSLRKGQWTGNKVTVGVELTTHSNYSIVPFFESIYAIQKGTTFNQWGVQGKITF